MRVLIVSSGNNKPVYGISSFVYEQVNALRENGVDVDILKITEKGFGGYFKAVISLNKLIKKKAYDVIHGHYGLSALVAILQFRVPAIATFIGSDIYIPKYKFLSKMTVFQRAKSLIFVSERLRDVSGMLKKTHIVPYGIDLEKYYPLDKLKCKTKLKWSENEIHILFASRFDRNEKNFPLAFKAIELLKQSGINCKIVEFRNIKAEDLNFYYNACDVFLLTSIYEGCPHSIKEAMACNCPIVSTDVGDVKWITEEIEGCFLTSFDPNDVAKKITLAIEFGKKNGKTKGRDHIIEFGLDSNTIAKKIINIYQQNIKK